MKKYFSLFAFFVISTGYIALTSCDQDRSLLNLYKKSVTQENSGSGKIITYLGRIEFPPSAPATAQTVRLYYKGNIISVGNGAFSLTENKKLQVFSIIAALLPPPTSNTLDNITVPEGIEYAHYTLFRTTAPANEEKKQEKWHIEKTTGNKGLSIPDDALIAIIDPSLIDTVTSHPWDKDSFTLKLPTFCLNKHIDQKTFRDRHNRSLLTALDWDVFHKREKWEHQRHARCETARKIA